MQTFMLHSGTGMLLNIIHVHQMKGWQMTMADVPLLELHLQKRSPTGGGGGGPTYARKN